MKKKYSLLIVIVLSLSVGFSNARDYISFNSDWQFAIGPFNGDPEISALVPDGLKWNSVSIPHTWNAADMQTAHTQYYEGTALYAKQYKPEKNAADKRFFLKFEGVGSVAHVFINKKLAGKHKGAYSAFTVEITNLLLMDAENEILVHVSNKSRTDVIPVNHKLFGVYGGIYRPIQLIITDKMNITLSDNGGTGVYISQEDVSKEAALIGIKVKINNSFNSTREIKLQNLVYDQSGVLKCQLSTDEIVVPQGDQIYRQNIKIAEPHLWQGLDDPYLYKVVTRLISNGECIDEIITPLGLRKIEVKASDGLYLNGKKVPMYGVCRHQDWWGIGSALTNENHDQDLQFIREIGATTIRLAHYQQSEYFYSRCDSIGFLVWAEIPFVNKVSTDESANAKQQMTELIRQNYNHPSIYTWGLHNEVYEPYAYTAQLTKELHDLAKTEDPYRSTISVNGYGDINNPSNSHADIQGINRYFGWYERKIQDLEKWILNLKNNYPHHKVMLAEYGAEGNVNQQIEMVGDVGDCCGPTKNYNETFQTKFHELQWSYIKNNPYLIASYVWNMFDFATPESFQGGVPARNMKGLMTFDRKIKKDAFYWYKANWSKEPVVYITQRRVNERTHQFTPVTVYSNIGTPSLFVNNKVIKSYVKGNTDIHYIFENVKLKKGMNVIKVAITLNNKKYEDVVEWTYINEEKQKVLDIPEKTGVHTGL